MDPNRDRNPKRPRAPTTSGDCRRPGHTKRTCPDNWNRKQGGFQRAGGIENRASEIAAHIAADLDDAVRDVDGCDGDEREGENEEHEGENDADIEDDKGSEDLQQNEENSVDDDDDNDDVEPLQDRWTEIPSQEVPRRDLRTNQHDDFFSALPAFSKTRGPLRANIPQNVVDPIDIFQLYWTPELIEKIIRNSN